MKLKTILLPALCLGISASALAVPARPGVRTFTQPDGSTIQLRLIGDERFHAFITTDGLTVARDADGIFRYRTADGLSSVAAHNPADRPADEQQFVAAQAANLLPEHLAAAARTRARAAAPDGMMKISQVPTLGSPRIPILLVQYSDYKFRDADPLYTFRNFFDDGEKSAYQYFVDQSNGKYTPQFEVYGPVTLSGTRKSYGGNTAYGEDVGVGKMVAEACELLDGEVDFSLYDNDGDRTCDVVIVIYAGDGEASSYADDAEDAVWPCQWSLRASDYRKTLKLDNTTIDKFAVFNELSGVDLTKIDGVGTFCHEYSHCLGLPDFYDTNYGPHFGMDAWSLLDSGSYNDDGYTPIGYSAYEKWFMGWIDIPQAKADTYYTLTPMNGGSEDTDMAVMLVNDADPYEYYILENRARQGWDRFIPAQGLMITHVTFSLSAWDRNTVNNYDMQRMTLIPADGELKLNSYTYMGETYYEADTKSLRGDLWPYQGATELTDDSTPAATVNKGGFMGKPITEITRNSSDGTVSFWAMKGEQNAVTGIETEPTQTEAEYYNLQGLRVNPDALSPGIYILRQNGTTRKVRVM